MLPGGDSWDHLHVRKYINTHEDEKVLISTAQDEGSIAGDHHFKKCVPNTMESRTIVFAVLKLTSRRVLRKYEIAVRHSCKPSKH